MPGFIMVNGQSYGAGTPVVVTQEQYDALPESKLSDNIMYLVKDGSEPEDVEFTDAAANIFYDNAESGLEAENVQEALDEIVNNAEPIIETAPFVISHSSVTFVQGHITKNRNIVDFYLYLTINANLVETTIIYNFPQGFIPYNNFYASAEVLAGDRSIVAYSRFWNNGGFSIKANAGQSIIIKESFITGGGA